MSALAAAAPALLRHRAVHFSDACSPERLDAALTVQLYETDDAAEGFGAYLWPCGRALAWHCWRQRHRLGAGASVVELGGGVGLPSLVAASVPGTRAVLTDLAGADGGAAAASSAALAGGSLERADLAWGDVDAAQALRASARPSVVLAADCTYESEHWEAVVATAYALLDGFADGRELWLAHQARCTSETLKPLLDAWGLAGALQPPDPAWSDAPGHGSVRVFVVRGG